ncbi:unnamed protein product [Orchesella dallaii]|uniref:DOMON domain-containing protein n=1 Tax=Orchesella dallaii TaxID=48710 RepID=A0ABP1RVL3_9HEXA
MNLQRVCSVFLSFPLIFATGFRIDNNPNRHVEILDSAGKYRLEWLVNFKEELVTFNVTVETKGWVGFGLSKNGEMAGADIVIGGLEPSGKRYFSDRHVVGNEYPLRDEIQDWILENAWESETHTSLVFSRKFDTCDNQDIPINDDSLALIWAFGEVDGKVEHFGNWESFNMYLKDPQLTPAYVERRGELATKGMDNVKVWTMENKVQLHMKRTTYWCNMHKISLPKKHHTIGYALQAGTPGHSNIHQILIFKCTVPQNLNPESIFEPFLTHAGEECYSPGTEKTQLPTQFCTDLRYGISIGGRSTFFPDHAGIPIGESENEYYLFQAHYDNPQSAPGILAQTKVDIYYTPTVRQNDMGVFSLGHHVPGSPSLILPPGLASHKIYGHCSSACTKKMFSEEGMKIVALLLHSHNQGRKLRLHHFRNGKELPWISNDDNYNVFYQPGRNLREEVTILPGDQVTMSCTYDTSNRNTTTVGGYGTDQEMCKTFITYYPKMDDYGICRSMIASPTYTKRYLGINNVTWDKYQLEYVASSPPELGGRTISEVSDTIHWNEELLSHLQREHETHPQLAICPISTAAPSETAVEKEKGAKGQHFVTFPKIAKLHRIQKRCWDYKLYQSEN